MAAIDITFVTYLQNTAGKSRRSIQDSDRHQFCKGYSSDNSRQTLLWGYKKDRQNRNAANFSCSNKTVTF